MKFLIIDDSGITRNYIKKIIQTIDITADFTEASDGKDAIHKMTTDRFDLLTVDLEMEGMDGEGFLTTMTKNPLLVKKRIVVISGSITKEIINAYKNYPNVSFYPKDKLHKCQGNINECLSYKSEKCLRNIILCLIGKN